MGASGWQHFVAYESNIGQALERLRATVFRDGTYYAPRRAKQATSIDALLARCGESGTHSVLDVSRVVDMPFPVPVLSWSAEIFQQTGASPAAAKLRQRIVDEAKLVGAVAPLSAAQLLAVFATAQPSHATVEIRSFGLHALVPRGCAIYVVVHDAAGAPSELFFQGKTGD